MLIPPHSLCTCVFVCVCLRVHASFDGVCFCLPTGRGEKLSESERENGKRPKTTWGQKKDRSNEGVFTNDGH